MFDSDMLDVPAGLACVAFLIPAADRRISAILQSSVVASSNGLVDGAGSEDEDADVAWVPLVGAFGFVTSFELMLFEGLVDDEEPSVLSGAWLTGADLAGGSPVAALKVERSDWKLMAAVGKMGKVREQINRSSHFLTPSNPSVLLPSIN